MEILNVKPNDLHTLDYNPKGRVSKLNLSGLLDSISRVGILSPLLVTKDYTVIDGHRRLACARELKLDSVPVVFSELDADNGFIECNIYTRRLSSRESFEVWRSRGAVANAKKKFYDSLKDFLSEEDLDILVERKTAVDSLYSEVDGLLNYLGVDKSPEIKRKVFMWMSSYHGTMAVRRARKLGVKPEIILDYINEDERLPY